MYILVARPALAQQPQFTVHNLPLPRELSSADNQFSGLSISAGKLFLLSESRLQDNAEAKLYTVQLKDLERQLADSTYVLPYQKLPLINLPALRTKINAAGQRYEGLEALLIDRGVVYLSVENDTHSPNGYLLRGALSSNAVVLDTTFLVPLAKPVAADGAPIYNAGFEALAASRRRLFGFFEFNYFSGENCAYEFTKKRLPAVRPPRKRRVERVPFRLTDITAVGRHRFTAINYFFQGGGEDAVYRTPAGDLASTQLIQDRGTYRSYARLLTMEWKGQKFTWRPLWEFPESYRGYNWEGLAAYHGGYFVINDKYTPQRPFRTTLLYLKRVP
ncbi:MAG TPA: hypothetical protein VF629_06570 [Hymenobacter sp.]|uniref:hypothetical protein n=1 Tax=Hymenobacter sp. TaxID=1898978 RepID=UPI002ED8AFAE